MARTVTGTDQIQHVAFSPDARFVAASGGKQPGIICDRETGELLLALQADEQLGGIAFLPDGARFAAASFGRILVWPIEAALGKMQPLPRPAVAALTVTPSPAPNSQPLGKPLTNVSPATASTTSGADQTAWALIEDTMDAQVLRRFIAQFPDSPRRANAEARLQRLVSLPPPRSEPARPSGRPAARAKGAVAHKPPQPGGARGGRDCFTFNGRRVCE